MKIRWSRPAYRNGRAFAYLGDRTVGRIWFDDYRDQWNADGFRQEGCTDACCKCPDCGQFGLAHLGRFDTRRGAQAAVRKFCTEEYSPLIGGEP